MESSLDLVSARAAEKGLELACRVSERAPAAVVGDVTRLRQVLGNLWSNAVKFTERGEIVLSVDSRKIERHRPDGGKKGSSVADHRVDGQCQGGGPKRLRFRGSG